MIFLSFRVPMSKFGAIVELRSNDGFSLINHTIFVLYKLKVHYLQVLIQNIPHCHKTSFLHLTVHTVECANTVHTYMYESFSLN